MKLYYHPISTTSRPVVLFAADCGIDLQYQLVDLTVGEQMQPAFAAINPTQAVPVLEDGDFRLTESSAILKYVAEKAGSPLYPADLRLRARVNERMDWINGTLSREFGYGFVYPQVIPHHRRPDIYTQQQTVQWARERSLRWLKVLDDKWLGRENRFLCGDDLTLADYLGVCHITLGEAVRIDFGRWPNIARWIARMKDRPAWAPANEAFYTYFVEPLAALSFEKL